MKRALLFAFTGALVAFCLAIVAVTDWLEIDWSFDQ